MIKKMKDAIEFLIILSFLVSPAITNAQGTPAPTLILSLSNSNLVANSNPMYTDLPTIFWSSTNATSCMASGLGWNGIVGLNGSQKVNPPVTTIYTLTCTGTGSSVTKNVVITVTHSQTATALDAFNQVPTNPTTQQTKFTYTWSRNLRYGLLNDADVSALQTALILEGVYSNDVTGGFFQKTSASAKQLQTKYGIDSTGFVGPITRAKLNDLYAK